MPPSSFSGLTDYRSSSSTSNLGTRDLGKRQQPSADDGSASGSSGKRPRSDDQAPCGSKPECMMCPRCNGCHHCGGKWASQNLWRDWRDLEMHFDGGSRPEKRGTRAPGLSGAGAIIYSNGEIVWKGSKFVGMKETNNTAEYEGLILGLRAAKTLGPRTLRVKGDSMLIIKQLDGSWNVNKPHLEELRDIARKEIWDLQLEVTPKLEHHRREFNTAADYLAKLAMNTRRSTSEFTCPAGSSSGGAGDDLRESSTQRNTEPRGSDASAFAGAGYRQPSGPLIETDVVGDDEFADIEEAERAALSQSSCGIGPPAGLETDVVGEDELAELAAMEASLTQSSSGRGHHHRYGGIETEIVGDDELMAIDAALSQSSNVRSPQGSLASSKLSVAGGAASSPGMSGEEQPSQRSAGRRTPGRADSNWRMEKESLSSAMVGNLSSKRGYSAGNASGDEIQRIVLDSPPSKEPGGGGDARCGAAGGGGHRASADKSWSRGGDQDRVIIDDDVDEEAANRRSGRAPDVEQAISSSSSSSSSSSRGRDRGRGSSKGNGVHMLTDAKIRAGREWLGGENEGLELDERQQAAYDACMGDKNVFLTGRGGSGKTFLLKKIIEGLRGKFAKIAEDKGLPDGREEAAEQVFACAPTGVAALLCGGMTLHSLLGCGVPTVKDDFSKMNTKKIQVRWRTMKVLVIDEISMVEPCFLDYLDWKIRDIRGVSSKAFGGIQLIVSGDFCQLPCVTEKLTMYDADIQNFKEENKANLRKNCSNGNVYLNHLDLLVPIGSLNVNRTGEKTFAFQTNFWKQANFEYFELAKSHRQSDKALIDALGEVRSGNISPKTEAFFQGLERDLPVSTGVVPTEIFCTNKDVEAKNESELKKLPLPAHVHKAKDSVEVLEASGIAAANRLRADKFFDKSNPTPALIELRLGAQVMCTRNIPYKNLVNGSRGVVKKFATGEEVLDEIDREIKGGKLKPYEKEELEEQKSFIEEEKMYPVVYFEVPDVTYCMRPILQTHEVYLTGTCKRVQVPLRLAWALTVHKCQGASLDKVTVQLEGAFENGQAYVALSRAKCVEGLQVKGFNKEQCMSDRRYAKAFHEALSKSDRSAKDFIRRVPAWFAPMIEDEHENVKKWRDLHLACNVFKKWVERWMPEEFQRIQGEGRGGEAGGAD